MSAASWPAPARPAHAAPAAATGRLAVALLDAHASPATLASLAGQLPDDCRARIARLRRPADQARATIAHAALRHLLASQAGGRPAGLQVVRAPSGQPLVQANGAASGWHVSLSHSGDHVAVALSDRPVGIDLEDARAWQPRDAAELTALADACLSPGERALATRDALSFLRCWTAKEAVLKAAGLGASGPWQSFDVGTAPAADGFHAIDTVIPALASAHVARFDAGAHCPASLCILGAPPARWTLQHWRADQIASDPPPACRTSGAAHLH